MNYQYCATDDENKLLDFYIKNCKCPIIYVHNQLDRFDPEDDLVSEMVDSYKSIIAEKGGIPIIAPISAYATFLVKIKICHIRKYDKPALGIVKKNFSTRYYDLSSYVKMNHIASIQSKSILDRTGNTLLESLIEK